MNSGLSLLLVLFGLVISHVLGQTAGAHRERTRQAAHRPPSERYQRRAWQTVKTYPLPIVQPREHAPASGCVNAQCSKHYGGPLDLDMTLIARPFDEVWPVR